AIVDMALGLGFDVVAEGVEDEAQADFLRQLGCPYVQGFYFSRPVEADKIPAMMGKLFVGDETIVMASVGKSQRR
ncbi:MAG TPA: EAL domain-containing protein, partial [Gammaproteobacteria bacterium]|nr:EAL domain-containing protein [Gammaproteobacteria bacterium]